MTSATREATKSMIPIRPTSNNIESESRIDIEKVDRENENKMLVNDFGDDQKRKVEEEEEHVWVYGDVKSGEAEVEPEEAIEAEPAQDMKGPWEVGDWEK